MIIPQILRNIPVRIANIILARFILNTKLKNKALIFKGSTLRYHKNVKLDLNPNDIGHQYLAFTGIYEHQLSKYIINLKKNLKGIMVDVGANYGYYSILWVAENQDNQAIAFEASPRNLEAIKNNIFINKLENQIKLEPLAISNIDGILTFDLGSEDQTGWGGITYQVDNENHVEVSSTTLDNYFKNRPEVLIDVLKIDTEGADYLVLLGAEQLLLEKRIKHIFWEENIYRAGLLNLKPFLAIDFLEKLSYQVKKIGPNEYYATI